jgi:DNA-binding NarL/FixJ family response regulator
MQSPVPAILQLLRLPVMPIVSIHELDRAVPLARALVEGGVSVFEVLLRTPVALQAIEAIRRHVPEATVGAGTLLAAADVQRAIDAGAMGFVTKRTTPQALLQALRAVLQGVIVVPDELSPEPLPEPDAVTAHVAVRPLAGLPEPGSEPGLDGRASLRACLRSLGMTPRQLDVLELLLQGKPNKLIARELRLSVETVKDHVRAVLRTLNVTTRTQAVLAVSRMLAAPGPLATWTRPLAP